MAVTNEIVLFCLGIIIYLVLAITWNFGLFKHEDRNNVMKAALVWLLLFLQPLITQVTILYATAATVGEDILKLYNVVYQVNIYVLIFGSFYFIIMFVYNVFLYFARVEK